MLSTNKHTNTGGQAAVKILFLNNGTYTNRFFVSLVSLKKTIKLSYY